MHSEVALQGEPSDDLAVRLGHGTISLLRKAEGLVEILAGRNLCLTTVESCTGGALAHFVTSISGSSSVLRDSFVTYSNEAKIALGVPREVIEAHTVYSMQTAIAMARAGLRASVGADIGVGITGSLSREDPENDNSVPGEVYLGLIYEGAIVRQKLIIPETHRLEAKMSIVDHALDAIQRISS